MEFGSHGAPTEPVLYTFKYDALGRRVETIQYVDEALGTRWDDGATPTPAPAPRRIRHVYAGLETIQEYACCTGTDACGETAPPCECGVTATGCGDGWPLAREIVWGSEATEEGASTGISLSSAATAATWFSGTHAPGKNRFPEPIVMVDFTGAGMPNTWDPNIPPPTPPIFYYYLHDALGSVVALTDNVGRVVERYTYDPYGRVVVEQPDDPDGPADANPCTENCEPVEWKANICGDDEVLTANSLTYSAYGNPFMWTGQRYDAATGTYHFHYRTYSPGLGRWLQRDPAGYLDGINLYESMLGDPISVVDPNGDSTVTAVLPFAGGAAAADGPLPIGDVIAAGAIAAAAAVDLYLLIEKHRERKKEEERTQERRWLARKKRCEETYKAYKIACSLDRRCDKNMTCEEIIPRIVAGMACLAGRNLYIGMGCDDVIPTTVNHHGERNTVSNVLKNCENLALQKQCFLKDGTCPGLDRGTR